MRSGSSSTSPRMAADLSAEEAKNSPDKTWAARRRQGIDAAIAKYAALLDSPAAKTVSADKRCDLWLVLARARIRHGWNEMERGAVEAGLADLDALDAEAAKCPSARRDYD